MRFFLTDTETFLFLLLKITTLVSRKRVTGKSSFLLGCAPYPKSNQIPLRFLIVQQKPFWKNRNRIASMGFEIPSDVILVRSNRSTMHLFSVVAHHTTRRLGVQFMQWGATVSFVFVHLPSSVCFKCNVKSFSQLELELMVPTSTSQRHERRGTTVHNCIEEMITQQRLWESSLRMQAKAIDLLAQLAF